MGRVTAWLFRQFRTWERPAQAAFVLAAAFLVGAGLAFIFGAGTVRVLAFAAMLGALIALQLVFMWANCGMVTPYTQAQRHYLAGDFAAALRLLEAEQATGRMDVRVAVLLGNTYRQVGRLDESLEVLQKTNAIALNDHYVLYGFGCTLLARGDYAQAVAVFQQVLACGGSQITQFDLGAASYYLGDGEQASLASAALLVPQDAARLLMAAYWLHRLGKGEMPRVVDGVDGLGYWRAYAERFAHTPYGVALGEDVTNLARFVER